MPLLVETACTRARWWRTRSAICNADPRACRIPENELLRKCDGVAISKVGDEAALHLHGGVHAGGDDLCGMRCKWEVREEGGGGLSVCKALAGGDRLAQLQVVGDALELRFRRRDGDQQIDVVPRRYC